MKPVILTNCQGYEWVDQFDLSLEAVTLVKSMTIVAEPEVVKLI